ncbi:lytic transglycosylase domain-containing protein [Frankia sp. CNm7]|uniref:Lytic transglycosylase domain-containing protein n=1 Tax=Frankia nepalensis TaxID=1836974 RepID=A0A937UQM4_9ACTN|nr:lytic transglycosylase domain-containing protein [Frankia nepalensis]MBL7498194.1 lytic transglycosylase domain-containing protein [Frankia nepalensis]MBL7513160.1 lytic transglycosylase domain-containing protein [Frankia nepalensis]MBL7521135.1 lytic transglycosylase domain-containing protein [Frankia nepalensis]MBL7628410.1 lytic transglycosylase domain-containing protein [Frankia nepalensis]
MSRQRSPRAPVLVAGLVCALAFVLGGCSQVLPLQPVSEIPADLVPVFQEAASAYGLLTPAQLAAQARVESRFDSSAVSRAGAVGMMQFLPSTWAEFGIDGDGDGVADPLNPLDAIPSAAHYEQHLAGLVSDLPGDRVSLILAAYNAGPNAVRAAGGIPDYAETKAYIAKIHSWAETYEEEI